MVLDIFLIVLTTMIVAWLLPIVIIRWTSLVEAMKWGTRGKEEVKERYFLYDLKEKKWVETSKDPTGGKENE